MQIYPIHYIKSLHQFAFVGTIIDQSSFISGIKKAHRNIRNMQYIHGLNLIENLYSHKVM